MTITINLHGVDKPDKTIDAGHVVLLADQEETCQVVAIGQTSDASLGQQLAGLYLSLKKERPGALWMTLKYIMSCRFRRHYYGRD